MKNLMKVLLLGIIAASMLHAQDTDIISTNNLMKHDLFMQKVKKWLIRKQDSNRGAQIKKLQISLNKKRQTILYVTGFIDYAQEKFELPAYLEYGLFLSYDPVTNKWKTDNNYYKNRSVGIGTEKLKRSELRSFVAEFNDRLIKLLNKYSLTPEKKWNIKLAHKQQGSSLIKIAHSRSTPYFKPEYSKK